MPQKNRRRQEFKELFVALPDDIQKLAVKQFALFLQNPNHPGLGLHALKDTKAGKHRNGSWAVSVTRRYRAIYYPDGDTNVWYWIGSHEDYNNFTGVK